jgi:hypothetical protein
MRGDRINQVKTEMKRLIKRIDALSGSEVACFAPSAETGAIRRASMDLTRALADLRRPDHIGEREVR